MATVRPLALTQSSLSVTAEELHGLRDHSSYCVENRLEGMRVEAGDLSGGCSSNQMGGDGGLGQGSSEGREKWSDSGFILKVEPTGFPDNWWMEEKES